ncbi:MAG: hypothetical protein PVH88_00850 [Ignavibacteria bacterium]|jgi:hypothetical protein
MEIELTLLGFFIGAFITLIVRKFESIDKFRLVAIEKRLQIHQEAFRHWYNMLWVIHKENEKIEVIKAARNFWVDKCLFLEKETRKEFDVVIQLVDFYREKLEWAKSLSDKDEKQKAEQEYQKDWNRIRNLAVLIQKEIKLEPIVPNIKITAEGN